jgi:hypothetical protein
MEVFGVVVQIMEKIMELGGKTNGIRLKQKWKYLGIILLLAIASCDSKKGEATSQSNTISVTAFDSLIFDLKDLRELMTSELVENKLIDTAEIISGVGETAYPGSTVQLNDSIFYSIITINDKMGICSYYFVLSINEKSKTSIASVYLHSGCDVDFSSDSYDLYEHENISKDTIKVSKRTIFQKKNRTSSNEDENIDHEKIERSYFVVSAHGKIHLLKKNQ